jgi:PHD/YefM family antitoxin component YafN of YafNO toxin-antitoxin module
VYLHSDAKGDRNVYTSVHKIGKMETLKVGIREFREKLATYLLETEVPVAITRHGDTIGYYIPARRKRSEAERTALKEAAVRLQQVLTAEGISEEEILNDFKQWRAGGRK